MFGVLIESRAKRQRRTGGVALSVAVHMAVISAVAARTVGGTATHEKIKPTDVVWVQPPPPVAHVVDETGMVPRSASKVSNIVIHHIDIPTIVPTSLPPIQASSFGPADSVVIGGSSSGTSVYDAIGGAGMFAPDRHDANEWDAREVYMHVLTPAKPRYPESLRSASIDGRVLVEFLVDTTGRVDMKSIRVISSTHDLFTKAVIDALPAFRFKPAELNGHHIAARAQMPFEFQLSGR